MSETWPHNTSDLEARIASYAACRIPTLTVFGWVLPCRPLSANTWHRLLSGDTWLDVNPAEAALSYVSAICT